MPTRTRGCTGCWPSSTNSGTPCRSSAPFWIGTHNSFNSASELFTPSGMDANQQVSLVDQLRMDVRSLEIEVHVVPSPWAGGAEALESVLGERIYRTGETDGDCRQLPAALTREDVLEAGAQVIGMGSCGTGTPWRRISFGDSDRAANESGGAEAFRGYPTCDPERSRAIFDAHLIRYFDDSTGLSAGVAFAGGESPGIGITPEAAAAMTRCGVDLTGFDQVLPDDGRLAALAWSWDEGEPKADAGDCTVERADARFHAERCRDRHAFACEAADGLWSVDRHSGQYRAGFRACRRGEFSVPRRGIDAQRLRDAMGAAGVSAVWVRSRR